MITFKIKGKIVGALEDDGIFRKDVKFSVHFFRKARAFGISEQVVETLRKENCKSIQITDTEKREIWKTDFEMFDKKSWTMQFDDYEPQKFLAQERWNIEDFFGRIIQTARPIDCCGSISIYGVHSQDCQFYKPKNHNKLKSNGNQASLFGDSTKINN
jgi:hypothetical protein